MTDSPDARVTDALHELPKRERRHLLHAPFRASLDSMLEFLAADEPVLALSGAVNSHLGRGVLALTDERVAFCCTRSGATSWGLRDIEDVEIRRGSFTLPAALTLHLAAERLVFALTGGRPAAITFCETVQTRLRSTVGATSGAA